MKLVCTNYSLTLLAANNLATASSKCYRNHQIIVEHNDLNCGGKWKGVNRKTKFTLNVI